MAAENAKRFLTKMMEDEALRENVAGMSTEALVAAAAELGFDVTANELTNAEHELRLGGAQRGVELKPEQLDKVVGGVFGFGEDAPDGKEMGCFVFYYKYDKCKEKGYWCQSNHYCTSNYYGQNTTDPHAK